MSEDIREIEGALEYVENCVIDNLNRHYSYNGTVPENLLLQVKKELDFIKETKTAAVFFYASILLRFSLEKGILDYENIYEKAIINVNVDTKWIPYIMGITSDSALPPHYLCSNCGFSDFENINKSTTAEELPRLCPNCKNELNKLGSSMNLQKAIEITDVMNDAIIEITFPIAKRHEILDLANHIVGKENRNYTGVKIYFK